MIVDLCDYYIQHRKGKIETTVTESDPGDTERRCPGSHRKRAREKICVPDLGGCVPRSGVFQLGIRLAGLGARVCFRSGTFGGLRLSHP